ncbi:MAG: hypothetical protein IPF50_17185 [Proteobacteria bacterium]|nr:hypothetical protein [Pseudomonadota bacterium]
MKTSTPPAVRVEPALRSDAEAVLDEGESLSDFVARAFATASLGGAAKTPFSCERETPSSDPSVKTTGSRRRIAAADGCPAGCGPSAAGGRQVALWAVTSYRVLLTEEAADDLLRIEDFIIERELASATPDLDVVRAPQRRGRPRTSITGVLTVLHAARPLAP